MIHENASSAAGTVVRDVRLSDFGACAAVDLPELRRYPGDDRNFGVDWSVDDDDDDNNDDGPPPSNTG